MFGNDINIKARVTRAVGGLYTLLDAEGRVYLAKPRGIFRKSNFLVLPGDKVLLGPSGDVDIPWRIDEVLERKNLLLRPPMTNLDFLFIVLAQKDPDPDFILLDKMLAYCSSLNIETCIVLTKTDLPKSHEEAAALDIELLAYKNAGFIILESSADTIGKSISSFSESHLEGKIWALAGPSGVGKSSLVNAILDDAFMDIGSISARLGRGKHTTRHVELIPYKQGYMVDTPGFSALEVADLELNREDLDGAYPDFSEKALSCRFADCRHDKEPGCAVKAYIEKSSEQEGRFSRYAILLEQIEAVANLRKEGKI